MRLVPMALPSSTDAFQTQAMLTRSLVLSKRLRWAYPDEVMLQGLKIMSLFSQQQATSSLVVMTRLETQPTPPPQHMDKVLNDTHLMKKQSPWLVDGNKWCDNKVDTRHVHCALKLHHGSLQRTTHIVMSVSKVAWMRIT